MSTATVLTQHTGTRAKATVEADEAASPATIRILGHRSAIADPFMHHLALIAIGSRYYLSAVVTRSASPGTVLMHGIVPLDREEARMIDTELQQSQLANVVNARVGTGMADWLEVA